AAPERGAGVGPRGRSALVRPVQTAFPAASRSLAQRFRSVRWARWPAASPLEGSPAGIQIPRTGGKRAARRHGDEENEPGRATPARGGEGKIRVKPGVGRRRLGWVGPRNPARGRARGPDEPGPRTPEALSRPPARRLARL